ncbi:MAG: hypothetical protein NVS4B12_02330 [Ktedonobacteraceae bacterium]
MSTPHLTVQLKEWEHITPGDRGKQLEGVFLPVDAAVRDTVRVLSTSDKLHISELRAGLALEATSYVGRITLGNIQITIQPKITGTPLLRLLRYAYGLRQLESFDDAEYSHEGQAFQELLIHQFVVEVNELVARGLHRRYIRTDHELASPRGRIDVQKIARQGGMIQATLPCTYHPRQEDCLINQVLLQGLQLAATLTNESALRIKLDRLAHMFQESVSSVRLDHNTLKQLHREMDRLNNAYVPAVTIIELLLEAEGISLDESLPQMPLPGFLFDMNLFFQELLSRFLKENLQGYTVQDQYKIRGMMAYDPDHNPNKRKAPEPRPDYIILQQSKVVGILDAKYRDLWERTLPSHMLYQLAIYALSQSGRVDAAILYPTVQAGAKEARIVLRDPLHQSTLAHVVLRPVNLLELDNIISSADNVSTGRVRTALAQRLAFGEV